MAYSAEVLKRARGRLAQAKADRESENQQHLQEAYREVPRLAQIDRELRGTMAAAVRAAFTRGGDVTSAMEQVREQNLALQAERQDLIDTYFEEGYLDESPVCDRCGGSGYVGSTMCECLWELCRQEQKKELSFLNVGRESFDQFRLDYYPQRVDPELGVSTRTIMAKTYQTCRDYADNFSDTSGNMLFSGDTGLGKTFISACIARKVADKGYSVVYESASHLFEKLEKAKFNNDEIARRETDKYTVCDLLIIDDLGTELAGQFTSSALYNVINDRILSCKSTIISTNLNNEELKHRYSPQIVSRLRGNYKRVAFVGEDIRVLKNRGI